jgi:hypothetical protein
MLEAWGLHGPVLLAGFAGGLVYVMAGKPTIFDAMRSLVMATLTTNYAYEVGTHYLGPGTGISFAAFFTGLASPFIVKALLRKAQSFTLSNGNGAAR